MMFRGRKGLDYASVFVLVTLILSIYLVIQVTTKLESFEVKVGESQVAVLNAYQSGEDALLYVDQAAIYSSYWALDGVARRGGMVETPCGTIQEGSEAISAWTAQGKNCLSAVQPYGAFSVAFNKRMNTFAKAYQNAVLPEDNYELFVQAETVTGTALQPASVWVKPPPGVIEAKLFGISIPGTTAPLFKAAIGEYSFRPSFTIKFATHLEFYDELKQAVTKLYDCLGEKSLDDCMKELNPPFTLKPSTTAAGYFIATAKNPVGNPYESMANIVFALYVPAAPTSAPAASAQSAG